MERGGNSDNVVSKQVCCSLMMLLLGLFFFCMLTNLAYFTYQTAVGKVNFCSLSIDIPGRLAVFATCYYLASLCGFLPLPNKFRLRRFRSPFRIWRFDSWNLLFRNIFLPTPPYDLIVNLRRNAIPITQGPETPLLQSNNQSSPNTERTATKSVNINYPVSYVAPVFNSNRQISPINQSPEIRENKNGSFLSIESSIGEIVFPMLKKKSSKPHYLSEASQESSPESPGDRQRVTSKYRREYTETRWTGKGEATKALVPVQPERRAFKQSSSERPVDENVPESRKLQVTRQQERSQPVNEMSKVPATDQRIGESRGNELFTRTEGQSRGRGGNKPPVGVANAANEQKTSRQLFNTGAQVDLPGPSSKNQQTTDGATASDARGTQAELGNTETELSFPRFPWCYLRDPRGVPQGATKLHKRHLELEKRLTDKYIARQRRKVNLERLMRSVIANLRTERVSEETDQPRISQNAILKSLLEAKNSSTAVAESSREQTATMSTSVQSSSTKDDVDQTKNRSDQTQRQEIATQSKNPAENLQLFSRISEQQTQQQEEAENVGSGITRCRKLPSQRFQPKTKIRSQIESEKSDIKPEVQRGNDGEDWSKNNIFQMTGQRTIFFKPGPSNLFSIKQNTERARSGSVTKDEETTNESFKHEGLTSRFSQFRRNTETEEALTTLQTDQNIEIQTTDASGRDAADLDSANKSSEGDESAKPDVEIPPIDKSKDYGDWSPE